MMWFRRSSFVFDVLLTLSLAVFGTETFLGLIHLDGNIYHGIVLVTLAVCVAKLRSLQERPLVQIVQPSSAAINGGRVKLPDPPNG